MKAIVLNAFGEANNFEIRTLATPILAENEVLVAIKSISVNPVDFKTRSGKGLSSRFSPNEPVILGWDISGVVTEVAKGVTQFKTGDEVFGMVNFPGIGNAYAELVAAPVHHLALKPTNVTFEEAAASTLAALTAIKALILLGTKAGDRLLIHAAAGGVGHFAVQLGKHFGAHVIGTASAKNKDLVLSFGADQFVDYRNEQLSAIVNDVDQVLDTIGDETIDISLAVMNKGGKIVSIPSGKNDKVVEKAAEKGITGMTMMVNSDDHYISKIAGYLADGILKPHIFKVFNFDQMAEAHQQVESGTTAGKVIVNVN